MVRRRAVCTGDERRPTRRCTPYAARRPTRRQIEAEADRWDLAALLDRAAPRGRLVEDLLGLSDDDLARLVAHVDEADQVRIMAESGRRDRAGQRPDVRPGLVGLSDAQLAARYRDAGTGPEAAAISAEAARRDLLSRLFPGGYLLADLAGVGDDDLAWAMQYADNGELLCIAAEMDRREAVDLPPPASTVNAVDDLLADRDALAEAMGDHVPGPAAWGALAADQALDDDAFWADLGDAAAAQHRSDDEDQDERHLITRREARALYDEYVYRQYLQAEADCRGYLLNKKAQAAGHAPVSLFSGPAHIAHARASDELKEWWVQHGRLTQAEFIEQVTGKAQRWADGARKHEADQQNKR
ncbi:hypothetical protein OG453_38060 [Streptomyces sp. NBC_01381]|uniref:hypothetical protein n=1 Tax=Streptomyces sp. NBC_01381 TaxID=2903845 RepID=UPI002252B041|nr:hypothetical protein [Streptomyces sp. NBC_01381]MCX4672398.1 hypothetical protein [Streptomyces sp. NBC_01381]